MKFLHVLAILVLIGVYCTADEQNHNELKKRQATSKRLQLDVKDCGTLKSCYISPHDCDRDASKCAYVLKWRFENDIVYYELKAAADGWTSVLFSTDKYVGEDNVVVCSRDGNTNAVQINHYYKEKNESDLKRLPVTEDGILTKVGQYDGGVIFCNFSRAIRTDYNLVNNLDIGHYVHVGRGRADEQINSDLLQRFQPSDDSVDFFTITRLYEPTSWLVRFHGTLMIIAWVLFASLGVLLARYYRPMWPNHVMWFRYRVWFSFHQPLMISAALMTLLAFLLILIEKDFQWSTRREEYIHSILGIIVVCCVIVNPILGLCRPRPDSRLRCLYFWLHWLIGSVAYCLAVPAIFIGMGNSKIHLPAWCSWLLFAWVIFHIVVEIILQIHYCCTYHRNNTNFINEYAVREKNQIIMKQPPPPGSRWKPTLLIVYAFVTVIVVIALVMTIFLRDIFA